MIRTSLPVSTRVSAKILSLTVMVLLVILGGWSYLFAAGLQQSPVRGPKIWLGAN